MIEEILQNRRQRAVIGDTVSDWSYIHSGVSQATVIGSIFLLFL